MGWVHGVAVTVGGETVEASVREREGRPVRVELPKRKARKGGAVTIDGQRYTVTAIDDLGDRDAVHLAPVAATTGIPKVKGNGDGEPGEG